MRYQGSKNAGGNHDSDSATQVRPRRGSPGQLSTVQPGQLTTAPGVYTAQTTGNITEMMTAIMPLMMMMMMMMGMIMPMMKSMGEAFKSK